ncbi:hypothetical protein [Acinetobacter baumannii]|uniref:hypothetical protein n=2 Tax=Acinetobacter baumannii TaxID=470 RepID=UPI003B43BB86
MRSKIFISVILFGLSACAAKADQNQLKDRELDKLVACNGGNTEYTNIDGYFTIPDFGCPYDGKNNKIGNAMVYLIAPDHNNDYIQLNNMKNIKGKYIYIVPFKFLNQDKKSGSFYIAKDNYSYEVYFNEGGKWVRKPDIIVSNNKVSVLSEINGFLNDRAKSFSKKTEKKLKKYKMDINHDGVEDFIEVVGKDNKPSSIHILNGLDNSLNYKNDKIFNNSFNECDYSSFDNISISKNNFTLEYSTCADSSQIGYRYATFKTDKNKEPILIQDNYLVSPREETSDNFKPKKVNCLTSSKITFNQFNGRCG